MQTIHSAKFLCTTSENNDFRKMVNFLDEDLNQRNGDIQRQYDQYNKIDKIKHAIVIYVGEKPVGCGCFKRYDDETVEMKRMFVLPEMRGKHLAAQLLQELETWALEEG
ncbi:MAG: GNAT family N-acetyltransferase, partial [Bacteroidota bacterium]|nr:GNAT family N-acetyltransferase [Bacteroidota bacterium]